MKKITVMLYGDVEVFLIGRVKGDVSFESVECYKSVRDLERDGFIDGDVRELVFMKDIISMSVSIDGSIYEIDVMGEYFKSDDYFESKLGGAPYIVQNSDSSQYEFEYDIELGDGELFDPKKLQLVKSEGEVEFLLSDIVIDHVMYDGREVDWRNVVGFDEWDDQCFLYEGFGKGCAYQF